ncbi:DUF4270 family protein [Aquimarina agarilytica]|uniref:DUF4270 family protein n=1 Tax=Aquimarina agarilytica TaxID=1087449 RepID=UPI000287CDA8|nr:DUF4270 family protein [Aquimarina agarilytica]
MNTPFLIRLFYGLCVSLLLVSCDDDISDVGSTILTGTNINVTTEELLPEINAVSLKKVQTSNLDTQYLGSNIDSILKNKSTYGILAQVSATTSTYTNTDPITKIVITGKKLILPFPYSTAAADSEGMRKYTFDPTFDESKSLKLQVFNANYTLRTQSLVSNTPQSYFADASDGQVNFLNFIEGDSKLISEEMTTINIPSKEVTISDRVKENLNAIEINLAKLDLTELTDKNDFNVFKGDNSEFINKIKSIYIKPDVTNEGLLRIPRVAVDTIAPKIQLDFKVTTKKEGEDEKETSFSADYNLAPQFFNIINTEEPTITNTESVLLKAGAGSIAETLLFDEEKLKELIEKDIIVNDAELILTVNRSVLEDKDLELKKLPSLGLYRTETGIAIGGGQNNLIQPVTAIENDNKDFTYNFKITSLAQLILGEPTLSDAKELNTKLGIGIVDPANNSFFSIIANTETTKFSNEGTILSFKGIPLFNKNTTEINSENKPKLILKYTAIK